MTDAQKHPIKDQFTEAGENFLNNHDQSVNTYSTAATAKAAHLIRSDAFRQQNTGICGVLSTFMARRWTGRREGWC